MIETVEARSQLLKRELGLGDLVLTQILFIVGLPWVGVAAKQGPRTSSSGWRRWCCSTCRRPRSSSTSIALMPLEGGLYQWAKLGFNELIGFMVAWNLWLFAILNTSDIGLQVTQYVVYIVGPRGEWLAGEPVVRRSRERRGDDRAGGAHGDRPAASASGCTRRAAC